MVVSEEALENESKVGLAIRPRSQRPRIESSRSGAVDARMAREPRRACDQEMRAPRSAARVVDGDRALVDRMIRTVGNGHAHVGKVRFTCRRLPPANRPESLERHVALVFA